MARLDGSVGGENALRPGFGQGVGKGLSRRQFFADQFQSQKSGVPFIHVKDRRLDAQGAQQPDAAHPQQHFLHDAHRAVAAINTPGQIAEMLRVFRAICVKKINRVSGRR